MPEQLFDPGPRLPPKPDFDIEIEQEAHVKIDMYRFVEERLDDYLKFEIDASNGWEPWEKPSVYLHEYLEGEVEPIWLNSNAFGNDFGGRFEINFKWTPELTEDLHTRLKINAEGTERLKP